MAGIFKACDIRGVFGDGLTENAAYQLGRALVLFLSCRSVVVGRDMRLHSDRLFAELVRGLTDQGADVVDLGLCSTPMSYFANGHLGADAGVMVTASHNSGEWNGFKLCQAQAIPISRDSGLEDIERIMTSGLDDEPLAENAGRVTSYDALPEYREHIRQFSDIRRPLKIAVDFANAMGLVEHQVLEDLIMYDSLFNELDGSFPGHEANPLLPETYAALQEKVRSGGYDFGLYYDGDADRAGFTDEKGDIISMDLVTALIAREILAKEKGLVLYDLRSSWATRELIEESGGEARMCRVGHAFIKEEMRKTNAVFAGELSGHYYFRENYYSESTSLAALLIANMVSASDVPLSDIVAPLRRYVSSGELNFEVDENSDVVFDRLKAVFPSDQLIELDGLSWVFEDWWFNVRVSNTEPVIRLNVEASTQAKMEAKRSQLQTLILGA